MTEYEEYERKCSAIREENVTLLDSFETWMTGSGLSETTAGRHRENIDFYINELLLYDSPKHASESVDEVGMFFGYWFIWKAMWANVASLKTNSTSLKKIYDFMLKRGEVDQEDVKEMKERIKKDLPEWIATMRRYDDPLVGQEAIWNR